MIFFDTLVINGVSTHYRTSSALLVPVLSCASGRLQALDMWLYEFTMTEIYGAIVFSVPAKVTLTVHLHLLNIYVCNIKTTSKSLCVLGTVWTPFLLDR